jgi:hypothetical protein
MLRWVFARAAADMTEERPPLGGRYAVQRPLERSTERFFAVDVTTGKRVVVALVDATRLSSLESARGIRHLNLAGIVDVLREVDKAALPREASFPTSGGAVIAEHVPGRTLRAQLAQGKLNPVKAVAWTLRLAEALQALHAAQAVHGAISPLSVIAEPLGRAIAPVLSQLVAPPLGGFCPPERLKGSAESPSDDVWGLYATLYAALTGTAPFKATTREALLKATLSKPKPLSAFGVEEPVLQEILQRGLLPDRHARASELGELVEVLDGWERDPSRAPARRAPAPRAGLRGLGDIVGGTLGQARNDAIVVDDDALPDDQGVDLPEAPAPSGVVLPLGAAAKSAPSREKRDFTDGKPPSFPGHPAPSSPTAASAPDAAPVRDSRSSDTGAQPALATPIHKRPSINPCERKRLVWPWVIVAALAGGAGVYLAVAPDAPEPEKVVEAPPPPKPKAPPKPKPKADPAELRDSCVAAPFPPETFEAGTSFAFVCEEADFVAATRRLHGMVKPPTPSDAGADAALADAGSVDVIKASPSKSPPVGLGLDWYELPATAIIKKTCCPGSAPVTLPKTTGWCEQLESIVQRVADDSQRAVDLAPGARAFDKAVVCLFANRIQHPYTYNKVPSAANRAAFQQFLSRAAIIGAQR